MASGGSGLAGNGVPIKGWAAARSAVKGVDSSGLACADESRVSEQLAASASGVERSVLNIKIYSPVVHIVFLWINAMKLMVLIQPPG